MIRGDFECDYIKTSFECHGTTLRLDWKIPRIKGLINAVPRKLSTDRCETTPKHMLVLKLPKQRWRRINPKRVVVASFVVQS